jgi:hypothetical protein
MRLRDVAEGRVREAWLATAFGPYPILWVTHDWWAVCGPDRLFTRSFACTANTPVYRSKEEAAEAVRRMQEVRLRRLEGADLRA